MGKDVATVLGYTNNRKALQDHVEEEDKGVAKCDIATRNRVIHGYDSVTPEFLWSLIVRHIPALLADVNFLLTLNE